MSKKLNRFLKNLPSSSNLTGIRLEEHLVYDMMGVQANAVPLAARSDGNGNPARRKKKTVKDLPDKVLQVVFEFLNQRNLKSLRLVDKKFNEVATDVFRTLHTPIIINSDDKIFEFNDVMEESFNFPFTRFRYILQPIKRHLLMTFTRGYDSNIRQLWIEPFERETSGPGGDGDIPLPNQHLLFKMTGILEELRAIEDLTIIFPSIGQFDYFSLPFEKTFDLVNLKTFSVKFFATGFCKFSSDLTLEILRNTVELKKFNMKLPEPCNSMVECDELRRVLTDDAARTVPSISLTLCVESHYNGLLDTLLEIIVTEQNSQIRNIVFQVGGWVSNFKAILKLIRATRDTLNSLKMFRHIGREGGCDEIHPIRLPRMTALRFLLIESHKIPIWAIERDQFPNLVDLCLHVNYGNEDFFKHSTLHPLKKLKVYFHRISIIRLLLPEYAMHDLFSDNLTTLELINPPAEFLTFMSSWAQNLSTLILSAPHVYGEDTTYPIEKVLGQLRGSVQFRDYHRNNLTMLRKLSKLHLLFPIDEPMAEFLVKSMPKLWQISVDDSKVSELGVTRLKYKHVSYVSWRYTSPSTNFGV